MLVQTLMLVQTPMLQGTFSEIPRDSDHLQCCPGSAAPSEGKGEPEGSLLTQSMFLQVDDDFTAQDYRLQYRKCTASHFEDVYVGSEPEFLVLHIDPNVDYQFRVCARGDGRQEWSPWSVPQIGSTTLVPHGTARPQHSWGAAAAMGLLLVWWECPWLWVVWVCDMWWTVRPSCNSFFASLAEGHALNLSQVAHCFLSLGKHVSQKKSIIFSSPSPQHKHFWWPTAHNKLLSWSDENLNFLFT